MTATLRRRLSTLALVGAFAAGIPLGTAHAVPLPPVSPAPPPPGIDTCMPTNCYCWWECEAPWWGDASDCIFVYKCIGRCC